jgi:antitoxin CcdA
MRMKNAHVEVTMQMNLYDPDAPKKSTNLSINSDLLRQAKALRINLSKALEQRLTELLLEKERQQWRQENREGFESYNRRIQKNGVFSEGLRGF